MTESSNFDEFADQLKEAANAADDNSSAAKKQKKTKISVSKTLKDFKAVY